MDDINSFIEDFLKSEFEKLQEIQDNYNTNIKEFSKLMSKVDPETTDIIRGVIDNLTLGNYTINNVKNNIAMKLYKRETSLKQEIKGAKEVSAKLELDYETLKETLNTLETERVTLEEKLESSPEKSRFGTSFLKEFQTREAQLRNELSAEMDKWMQLKTQLEEMDATLSPSTQTELKRLKTIIDKENKELKKTEQLLKSKLTEDHTSLKKKKDTIKENLSEAKKKYETIKKDLKSGKKDPEEVTELKSEMASIITTIDLLVKEYNNLLKILELKKEDLYAILQLIPGFSSSEFDNIVDYNGDQLNQSLQREKELQRELDTAERNVEELKAQIEEMDTTYQTEIKAEHERLQGKLVANREQNENAELKNKFKTMLDKQTAKHQKELELAGKRIRELEQYIAQPASRSPTVVESPTVRLPSQVPKVVGQTPGIIDATVRKPKASSKAKSKKPSKKSAPKGKCGACGIFISANSDSCPNCGVKFTLPEQELGACGACGNLIPVSLTQCPMCGAKFK